ncbi:MAG: aldehyde ferredoxin oxidoreductase family protein [Dehalococcoidia bacterium]
MPLGFNDRILHVDLTAGTTTVEEPGEEFFRRYLGGRALIAHYLLKLVPRGADPLGPDNALVFAPGIVTSAPFSGQGRNGIGAKSPLTGGFGNSEVGGFWGAECKRAGFDAIVVRGRAAAPVYLYLNEGQAELRDATRLWGQEVLETEEALRAELGKGIRTCMIGPAGENLVRYAAIINDVSHFAGRTGLGAVMGSKNLKAIAARGKGALKTANPRGIKELATWQTSNLQLTQSFHEYGTAGGVRGLHLAGGLPTFNFQEGAFDGSDKISGQTMTETILVDRDTCFACAVRCKRVVEVDTPEIHVDRRYGGPEYETLAAVGSNCGINDLNVLAKASERMAALGLDTISTGMTISFVMEAFEKGLITKEDTGGLDVRFGDAKTMLQLVDDIGYRRGFGADMAEGSKRLSEKLGRGTDDLVLAIKGQELPMHEPRIKHGLGLGYVVSPTGADHMHNMHDTAYLAEGPGLARIREFDSDLHPIEAHGFSDEKLKLFYYHSTFRHFFDSVGMCHFLPYSPNQLAGVISAITGWEASAADVLAWGERGATLARLFNLREGFTTADDKLPARFFSTFRNDNSATGKPMDEQEFRHALLSYYARMGWDIDGVPTAERLDKLDLGWAKENLAPA